MTHPKITFRYASAMDRYCELLSGTLWREKYSEMMGDSAYPGPNELRELSNQRQEIWKKIEQKVLLGLCEVTGLNFIEDEIIVYTVGFGRAHSDPLVLPSNFDSTIFVNVVIHELVHRLLTFNTAGLNEDQFSPQLFPEEDRSIAIHICVHALLKYLFCDVLDEPARLQQDIDMASSEYKKAWDIVQLEGYIEIIEKIRALL